MRNFKGRCPICQGYKVEATTTFTVDLDFGIVVVRHVPATVCEQCSTEWIDDKNAEKLEELINEAKAKHSIVEISEFPYLERKVS